MEEFSGGKAADSLSERIVTTIGEDIYHKQLLHLPIWPYNPVRWASKLCMNIPSVQ